MLRKAGTVFMIGMLTGAAMGSAQESPAPRLYPDRLYDSKSLLASADPAADPALSETPGPMSPKLAMLYSLILPGLGEYALGHRQRAAVFFVAEGAIWTSFIVFQSQGSHRKDLYREFASVHAGAGSRDDDDFYRTIGNYIASDGPFSANEQIRREARALFPDDPSLQDAYYAEHAYTGDDAWRWESEQILDRYQEMRDASISAYHKSEFSIGLLVANRLISVVDAGLLAARRNREVQAQTGFRWGIQADPDAALFTVSRTF